MLHGPVQIAGVDDLAVSPNILWSWAIACCAGTLLAASPALMGSSAPPGTGSSLPGTAVIFVDDDNCPGPGSGSELDPYCSIQTGIDNAVDGDEIVVAPGTYFETINFLGKAITLRSSDGADVTTIDAHQSGFVVSCRSGEAADSQLVGFTIKGGLGFYSLTPFFGPWIFGGGMLNVESSPTVIGCVFSGNVVTGDVVFGTSHFSGGGMVNYLSSRPRLLWQFALH